MIGREQHLWDMMYRVATSEGAAAFDNGVTYWNGMNSVVSATSSADNQMIYYDHWEDGFEVDILNPVQSTTLIIGDGIAGNGQACDFTTDPRIIDPTPGTPCGGLAPAPDALFQGSFVNFNSNQGIPGVTPNPNPGGACQGGLPAPPLDQRCSVPVNPRCPTGTCTDTLRFDGGDRIMSSGGPLSLLHPQDPLSPYIGGATEIISLQAVANALSYSIPVGEDIYAGNGSVTEPFKYTDLDLVAFEDGTQVFIDSPGAGTVNFTLNQGEHYSSQGWIEDTIPAPAITVNAGTKASTTKPISGLIFTGGDGTFATRLYTLLPDLLHSTDYMITAPGDDPAAQGSRPLNLYILNPDPLNPANVTVTDSVGTSVVAIPANSMVDYNSGTGRFVPSGSTVRLTSNRNFWGVSAYDHNTAANDWGHSWLAKSFVTATYTVSFAQGVTNPGFQSQLPQRLANDPNCTIPPAGVGACDPLNRSPIFVSPTLNNTQIQFDFDNDGRYDLVDLDGDDCPDQGSFSDATCALISATYGGSCGLPPAGTLGNCIYNVNVLQSIRAYDYTDYDNSGTRIVANKPVAVAYGQDTDQATGPDPIQDTGYIIYPINQAFLDPVLVVDKSTDTTSVPIAGGVATYTITVSSYNFGPLINMEVYDLLPAGVLGTDYVTGSTLITYPNLAQNTTDPATSLDPSGQWRLDWALSPDTMQTNQRLTVRYSVNIPPAPAGPRRLTNEGHANGTLGGSVFSPFDTAKVVQTDVVLVKSVDVANPGAGDVLTFTIAATNTGASEENNVFLTDAIPANTTFVPLSIINDGPFSGVFDPAQNAVVWTAGTFSAGTGPFFLSFQAQVNPGVPAGTDIPNRAGYESLQTPYFLSNEVEAVVVGPELVVWKTGPSLLHPNEIASFSIHVDNVGSSSANNVRIVDPFPTNATYVPGSMTWRQNTDPFVVVTDAADADEGTAFVDRLELLVATIGPNQDITFRFNVRVDPGTEGLFVNNQATVSSNETLPADTNLVQAPIVGGANITGHVFLDSDGDGAQDPGEPDLANIDVLVTDSTGVTQTVTTDANGDYLATVAQACYVDGFANIAYDGSDGDLDWSVAGYEWTEFSANPGLVDQDPTTIPLLVEADPLGVFGDSLLIEGGPAAANRGFTRQVNLSAAAGFTQGFASLSFNYRRVSMEATDSVQLDIDYDNNGVFNDVLGTFPGIGTDGAWQSASYVLDSAQLPDNPVVFRFLGSNFNFNNDNFYVDNVRICDAEVTADVDETDPNFPPGATLTTANDPQSIASVYGGTVATGDVGYQLPALTFTKRSDAPNGLAAPGQTMTYTLSITNNTGVIQTGITVTENAPGGNPDGTPAGTSYVAVPGTRVSLPNLRVTEYFVASGSFPGTTFDLSLNQDLFSDYFVIVQGSDGDTTTNNNRGPDENYARLTQDPFGTADLAASSGTNVIRLERGNAVNSWVGVVTVVECLTGCNTSGFRLRSVDVVQHQNADLNPPVVETAFSPWVDVNQVMLVGGFNGAGCSTAEASVTNTKVCHARIWPSGTDTINWTRNAGGATLSTATSTVMAVEWGSEWTVQRVHVTGNNGGDGADVAGEYNTAPISGVARDNTWVWGIGHTDDQGIGDAGEGMLITLGDGENQNATEFTVAVGQETGDNVDFEVYALTHPDLAVDYRFVIDGTAGIADSTNGNGDGLDLIEDVTVDAATRNRMSLVTNGCNGTGDAYPRPMFSARYLNDTTVRLERRRSGQQWPAWVQGIDFSNINVTNPGNAPANLVAAADGYSLGPGETIIVTFPVIVDNPLDGAITQITNTATLNTNQEGPFNASVTDDIVRPAVTVEPNNAGFALPGSTIWFSHDVVNRGLDDDSFEMTVTSELGWVVELIDPDTGGVIATDSDGDGIWDGGVSVNTGTLAPLEFVSYDVRVTVPGGTPIGTEETTNLIATSDLDGTTWATGTDETLVIDVTDPGPVKLLPDNSGVVTAGNSIAYTHRVANDTGATDTFDLSVYPTGPGWTAAIYFDNNGDGVYTPGIDIEVSNTAQLADGESQILFVVVTAPAGALPGESDVTHIAAVSRNDQTLLDTATDTTTVIPATTHDLSGGGTLLVDGGDTAVHPGTLTNLQKVADRFEFSITQAWFYGQDGFAHGTRLIIDTTGDGTPDTQIAEDIDGDGVWDTVNPAYDTDADGLPDVSVPAGTILAYELRRPVDPLQTPMRDPVTLSARSMSDATQVDSVTATDLLAAATAAVLASFESGIEDGLVVLEWKTASEVGTLGFDLFRKGRRDRQFRRVNERLLRGLLDAPQGGTYRYVDTTAVTGETYDYRLVELEAWGTRRVLGTFTIFAGRTAVRESDRSAQPLGQDFVGKRHRSRIRRPKTDRTGVAARRRQTTEKRHRSETAKRLKLTVRDNGLVYVSAAAIAQALDIPVARLSRILKRRQLELSNRGVSVAWLPREDAAGLYFYGEATDSIYTDDNVYWIDRGKGQLMLESRGRSRGRKAASVGTSFTETLHAEQELWPLTSVLHDPDGDFWFWDYLFAGIPGHDSKTFTFSTPGVAPTMSTAHLTVHLQGSMDTPDVDPDHHVTVWLNGKVIGEGLWEGNTAHDLNLEFNQSLLNDGVNIVVVDASTESGVAFDVVYLDSFDVRYQRRYLAAGDQLLFSPDGAGTVTIEGFHRPDITVFNLSNPNRPKIVRSIKVDSAESDYRVTFTAGRGSTYLATALETVNGPLTLELDQASGLRASRNSAEYIVIAPPGLESAAETLADFRRRQGLTAIVAGLEDIYDEFNHGIASPWAIRNFLAHAHSTWAVAPRYVVLAGDGSLDYKDRQGAGDNLIFPPMVDTPQGLVPSDQRLADLSGNDGVPEIAIGRIPVQDATELSAYVAKLEARKASLGPWRSRALWVADDPDHGGEFVQDSEVLIVAAPDSMEAEPIYLSDLGIVETRRRIQEGLRTGAMLLTYLGHGGLDRLADEGLIVTGDVPQLANGPSFPVITALTCMVGRFELPGYDSLAETLVLQHDGGAIALWAPSGMSMNEEAKKIGAGFLRALSTGEAQTLGDAVRSALSDYVAGGGDLHHIPFIYTLLGDPAVSLEP